MTPRAPRLSLSQVDYCARRFTTLARKGAFAGASPARPGGGGGADGAVESAREYAKQIEARTRDDELRDQTLEIEFACCVSSVTVARFVCEHLSKLGPSVMTRVLDTHDLLVAAVPLIENPPWTRRDAKSGKWQKLVDQKWRDVPAEQLLDLTKLEAQLWLLLYHLVCSPDVRRKYILHSFRKGQLLRVRKFLNEVMLDQLPVLADVQRFLDELTIYDSPDATANFASGAAGSSSAFQIAGMMEQVAALHEKIHKGRDWDQVAGAIVAPGGPFGEGSAADASDESLAKLVGVYTQDGVEELLGEGASKTKELYAQPVAGLTLLAVRPAGLGAGGDGLAEHAVEYEKIPGQDAIVETSSGHFVRTSGASPPRPRPRRRRRTAPTPTRTPTPRRRRRRRARPCHPAASSRPRSSSGATRPSRSPRRRTNRSTCRSSTPTARRAATRPRPPSCGGRSARCASTSRSRCRWCATTRSAPRPATCTSAATAMSRRRCRGTSRRASRARTRRAANAELLFSYAGRALLEPAPSTDQPGFRQQQRGGSIQTSTAAPGPTRRGRSEQDADQPPTPVASASTPMAISPVACFCGDEAARCAPSRS